VLLEEFCRLDRMARTAARNDAVCRRLMTVPGVGVIGSSPRQLTHSKMIVNTPEAIAYIGISVKEVY
jgi:hypothetical protein